jgi:hypothetical protein
MVSEMIQSQAGLAGINVRCGLPVPFFSLARTRFDSVDDGIASSDGG